MFTTNIINSIILIETNKTPKKQLKISTIEVNKNEQTNPVIHKLHSNNTAKISSHANRAIQKWQEEKKSQSQSKCIFSYFYLTH